MTKSKSELVIWFTLWVQAQKQRKQATVLRSYYALSFLISTFMITTSIEKVTLVYNSSAWICLKFNCPLRSHSDCSSLSYYPMTLFSICLSSSQQIHPIKFTKLILYPKTILGIEYTKKKILSFLKKHYILKGEEKYTKHRVINNPS